jgi:hypothetical protein
MIALMVWYVGCCRLGKLLVTSNVANQVRGVQLLNQRLTLAALAFPDRKEMGLVAEGM